MENITEWAGRLVQATLQLRRLQRRGKKVGIVRSYVDGAKRPHDPAVLIDQLHWLARGTESLASFCVDGDLSHEHGSPSTRSSSSYTLPGTELKANPLRRSDA
jgi:hypothetical protein